MKMKPLAYSIILITNICFIHPSFAEQNTIDTVQDNNSPETLPVINLKAQESTSNLSKKTQTGVLGDKSILDTPFSITVVDSSDIEKRGADTVGQIFINDPAVYSQSAAKATNWWGTSVRGLGVKNFYIDGMPMSLNWGGDYPAEFADSVTVLKGLTGFMYGFGSPGGAISYQLKRAKENPETDITVGYRNPTLFNVLVDHSDHVDAIDMDYRVTLGGEKGEAYNGSDQNRFIASLALDKKISDNLTWKANISYEDKKTEHEPPIFSLSKLTDGLPKATYDYDKLIVDNSFYKTKLFTANTAINWQFDPDWSLDYQVGYTRKLQQSNLVFNYLTNTSGDYTGSLYQFAYLEKSFINQIVLAGNFSTGSVKHELNTGLGYTNSTVQNSNYYWNGSLTADGYIGNIFENQNYIITHPKDYSLKPKSSDISQSYAFISDTLNFNDKFQAILGARYTYYDSEDLDYNPASNSGYSTKATTPTFALIYKPTKNSTTYLSYVESLENGGIVGSTYKNAGEVLDATISKQYELGLKYDANLFSATAAIFKIQRAATITDANNYLSQDGITNYNGIELNTNFKPTSKLKIGAGMMYMDAEIDKVSASNIALIGNRPAGVAKWTGTLNGEYLIDSIAGLSLHGNVRYNGDSYTANTNTVEIPSYILVNGGLAYQFNLGGHDATLNANMNNILNKKYWASSGTWASIGEGRNGVVSLNVKW